MPTQVKELLFNDLMKSAEGSDYIFFARFKGISVSDVNDLRRRLEKTVDRVVVVKNSIARLVLERMNAQDAAAFLEGQVMLTIGKRDPQAVSKVLVDFAKDRENFELRGICLDKKVFQSQFVKDLAKLPSKQELLAMVAGGMKAPISGFVMGLGQLVRSLVNVLDQIQKTKGQ